MSNDQPEWDYLFVSDLHLSLGYDSQRRAYHAREDFFFDQAFFRWLRWADENCAAGRRWELVLVGDIFDFLPVDEETVAQYFRELDRRQRELDPADPGQVVQYWQRQFGVAPPEEQAPERIQRILFEDDVLAGLVRLEPFSPDRPAAMAVKADHVPEWAVRLYGHYHPEVEETGATFALRAPAEGPATAFLAEGEEPDRGPARQRNESFERRYGFLSTPEKSVAKLESIYRGHPLFFRALAWFIGRGHRIVIMRGNHDLELFWPQVQERLRELIAREYPAACDTDAGHLPADFQQHIIFRPGWFHYRKGIFYAEHGMQYEPLNSCPNPIRPVLPDDEWVLNPPVGSLAVLCFHNHLEDEYPEWENRGSHAIVLLELVYRYPLQMISTLVRHGLDFLHMSQRLWLAGKEKNQEPTEQDFADYADVVGLEPDVVQAIYREIDTPLLLRRPLAWFLFSPVGHILKIFLLLVLAGLVITGGVLWYLVIAPALASLIPASFLFATVGPILRILVTAALWLVPPVVYEFLRRWMEKLHPGPFLYWAVRRVHRHLREEDPDLRYYIVGHDHKPDVRVVERRDDHRHVYCLDTGSWVPWFAEGKRRLQTLGREVQFSFAWLVKGERGYEAELLRWNDDAGRADLQIVPPAQPEE